MTWGEFVSHKPVWWRVLILLALAYLALGALLFFAQRRLIFLPSNTRSTLPPGFEEWLSPTGSYWGYKRIATNSSGRCLFFFQGNGGDASVWSHAVPEFPGDIFVLEYPGYGQRPGHPSERALKEAALQGFETEHSKYKSVYVCGQSLGAAVTEPIFTRHPDKIEKLILVTPFVSLSAMARAQFAFMPTGWILRDKMELYDHWLKFPGRSVVVIAGRDEIIPQKQRLRYAAERSAQREIIEFPNASHNTLDLNESFWTAVIAPDTSTNFTLEAVR